MAATHESNQLRIFALRPAAIAFDAVAPIFDSRFGAWQSVSAQRRAVRAALLHAFPPGGYILELGGGTGEDAAFLAQRLPALVGQLEFFLAAVFAHDMARK